jgi:2-oxoglutarate dehydrogenase E1 component
MSGSDLSILSLAGNLSFIDEIYQQYRKNPDGIDISWRQLFETNGSGVSAPTAPAVPVTQVTPVTLPVPTLTPQSPVSLGDALWLAKAWALVNAFRSRGHLESDLDPLGLTKLEPHPELDPRTYGFTEADLDRTVPPGFFNGAGELTLRELLRRCRTTYCRTIGVEFMHLSPPQRKQWLFERMESSLNYASLDRDTKLAILDRLARAEFLERFVHNKYIGTKRFSLEGGETLVPLLDLAFEHAGRLGMVEVVMGMAHRGRLNVLAHTLGKRPREIFAEFEDIDPHSTLGSGDVKYHLGYSSDHTTRAGHKLHLSLTFNPSHLEAVDPIVTGRVRAKQRRIRDFDHEKVLGILIHGDAAFAGQGLVGETLNLSEIRGYRTGGTLHIIVNNQIGFTASPLESRSTPYATDVAKMLQCPIFHVNGEDPEAVAHVVKLAMEYRHSFRCDVVIDMYCYRKYGHNESDEPAFTQPLMYQRIEQKEPLPKMYAERLIAEGVTTRADVDAMLQKIHDELEVELASAKKATSRPQIFHGQGVWAGYRGGPDASVPEVDTGIGRETLEKLGEMVTRLPEGFTPHPKIARLFETRRKMSKGEVPVDWGMGEILAFGSILLEGTLVRLSGQDSCRGTFSQRHAVVVDIKTGDEYMPLSHMTPDQAECRLFDSPLSEAAVLGFEYGYSLDWPDGLVAWEAQFGDFVNGAQVIIDQFLASAEDKWKRLSGLTLLLPHGYEGQGPEHSSARFERFLQLAAEDNIQVCNPTTPAQYYHLLRRQVVRKWRKPLIVLTPKSLLRLPAATSPIEELATGRFQRILGDEAGLNPAEVKRIFLCSGKVYYDLAEERKKRNDRSVAILRLEMLYPWSEQIVSAALEPYMATAREVVWVQEEPANMGAFTFVDPRIRRLIGKCEFRAVMRVESASPATGSSKAHAIEQRALLDEAFRG